MTRLFGMPYTLDNGASLGVPIEIQTTLEDHAPERNTVAQDVYKRQELYFTNESGI